MSYTKRQGMSDADAAMEDYGGQLKKLSERAERIRATSSEIKGDLEKVLRQISDSLIKSPGAQDVRTAVEMTGFSTLGEIVEEREREYQKLSADLERITTQDPGFNSLKERIASCEKALQADRHASVHQKLRLALFDDEIQWYQRHPSPTSFFGKLFDLSAARRARLSAVVEERFGKSFTSEQLISYEKDIQHELRTLESRIESSENTLKQLKETLRNNEALSSEVSQFEEKTFEIIRNELQSLLTPKECARLRLVLPKEYHDLLGKAAALEAKLDLLLQLAKAFRDQIQDRNERVESISRVRRKWARSKRISLRSDKSAWLRDNPQRLNGVTDTWIDSSWLVYATIAGFDDYVVYSTLLGQDSTVIPFLVFQALTDEGASISHACKILPEFQEAYSACPNPKESMQMIVGAKESADETLEMDALGSVAAEIQAHEEHEPEGDQSSDDVQEESGVDAGSAVENDLS